MRQLLLTLLIAAIPALAQEFEVATIKPSAPASAPFLVGIQMAPGGRLVATGLTVKLLIQQAYQVKDFQISGGPGWISSERFDINAKGGDGPADPESIRPMLQALLKTRFHLEFHRDSKELPVYNLVVAKNGAKLKEIPDAGSPGAPQQRMVRMGRGSVEAQQAPISLLATHLSNTVGRNIIDKTELKGQYEFRLEWTPEPGPGGGPFGGGPGPGSATAADSTGPTLFTALQEQLGLKLEPAKGPVDILVLDRVEKPTEN